MGVDEAKIQLELIEFQQNVVAVKEIFLMAHLKTSCQRKAPGISKFFPLLTNGQWNFLTVFGSTCCCRKG